MPEIWLICWRFLKAKFGYIYILDLATLNFVSFGTKSENENLTASFKRMKNAR